MLLVAIDTSGRKGSVALCRGDSASFEALQVANLEGGTYSARLMPVIAELLRASGFEKRDIDGFVVVSGPGSFTGLRVGLATAKALCEVLGKPLAVVSMLEAVASTHGGHGVTVVLDAGRGEVYVGEYRAGGERATVVREYILKLAEFPDVFRRSEGTLLTPDAAVAESLRAAGLGISLVDPVRADQIGRIGLRKLQAGEVVDPATVDVNYIRRSDAEIFAKPGA